MFHEVRFYRGVSYRFISPGPVSHGGVYRVAGRPSSVSIFDQL